MPMIGTENNKMYTPDHLIRSLQELVEAEEDYVIVLGKYIHKDGDTFTVQGSSEGLPRIGPFAYDETLFEEPEDIRKSVGASNTHLMGATIFQKENLSEEALEILKEDVETDEEADQDVELRSWKGIKPTGVVTHVGATPTDGCSIQNFDQVSEDQELFSREKLEQAYEKGKEEAREE